MYSEMMLDVSLSSSWSQVRQRGRFVIGCRGSRWVFASEDTLLHAGRLSTVDGLAVDGGMRTAKDIEEVGCTHRYNTQ
jgi:hypothetical protein